jgi:hypothetical protein
MSDILCLRIVLSNTSSRDCVSRQCSLFLFLIRQLAAAILFFSSDSFLFWSSSSLTGVLSLLVVFRVRSLAFEVDFAFDSEEDETNDAEAEAALAPVRGWWDFRGEALFLALRLTIFGILFDAGDVNGGGVISPCRTTCEDTSVEGRAPSQASE